MSGRTTLYTIGHSNHTVEHLLALLEQHHVTAVADVRSVPYSQYTPQFNREGLRASLRDADIAYVFLGDTLGARSDDPACCENGKVQFDRVAASAAFQSGLNRLRRGLGSHRIALLCTEKDPMACHRMILVCRQLRQEAGIQHILEDGSLEDNAATERRLMAKLKIPEADLFMSHEELVASAYERQGARIAHDHSDTEPDSRNPRPRSQESDDDEA